MEDDRTDLECSLPMRAPLFLHKDTFRINVTHAQEHVQVGRCPDTPIGLPYLSNDWWPSDKAWSQGWTVNPATSAAARKLPNLALTVRSHGLMPAAVHES